ncbi:MAG: SpoIID/LytB domain-containing protein [Pseudomonadota bacterium]
MMERGQGEPVLAVALVQERDLVEVELLAPYQAAGLHLGPGPLVATRAGQAVRLHGDKELELEGVTLQPVRSGRFALQVTIGIDFHWQQSERQEFVGALRLQPGTERGVTLINEVPLETYLTSVICSEMSATSPPELMRAHAVISRSWLLAQVREVLQGAAPTSGEGERILWYDRQAHRDFDVCADDHCQRYQGQTRVASAVVEDAIRDTRGLVLVHGGEVCDARFSKCCGGVTEAYATAWHDLAVPYLVAFGDRDDRALPQPPLTDEAAARAFVTSSPAAHCRVEDALVLKRVLPHFDQETQDFFRWRVRLTAGEAGDLVRKKLGVDLGRLRALQPVQRAASGRLVRLRLVGEKGTLVIGKELEIRRALSPSHLYSSAFVVDVEGPAERPEAFVLRGAGWGHGVGLCQIGAAAMATAGRSHQDILAHYYPSTTLESWYD